jgi:hypothetical protein
MRFFRQPNRAYRNAWIILGALGIHFLVASCTYVFAPLEAIGQFRALGALVGQQYVVSEFSHVWRILGAGNVFTLGVLCFAIVANPRRNHPLIPIFVVLKGFSALGFLSVFVVGKVAPWSMLGYAFVPFLGVCVWDAFNAWLVWHFGWKACRSLESSEKYGELVPRLRWNSAVVTT